jgi:hypothetical protein
MLPFSLWLMKHTMLGNPLIQPWRELAALCDDFQMRKCLFGSYYICRAVKPSTEPAAAAEACMVKPQSIPLIASRRNKPPRSLTSLIGAIFAACLSARAPCRPARTAATIHWPPRLVPTRRNRREQIHRENAN